MEYNDFTKEWLNAWNNHDLEAIMKHYDDDVEFYSPIVAEIFPETKGHLTGTAALREYFDKALSKYPDLHFDLHKCLTGIQSVVLYYSSVKNLKSAEFMLLNEKGKVINVRAHYAK
ncbi:MAG: nuclear transport factor 2 family protein [Prolixibacteraceae bacterium]